MSFKRDEREHLIGKIIEYIGTYGRFSPVEFARAQNTSIQTIYRYLRLLEDKSRILVRRSGRKNDYSLAYETFSHRYMIKDITEDKVWRDTVYPLLKDIPENALRICNYAFTELLNNAIEHSGGTHVDIIVKKNAHDVFISLQDDGVGIFAKIAEAMNLDEKRFAVLELAKGKFTTDPDSHSGEGIFFSSKAADFFAIYSDELLFVPVACSTKTDAIDSVLRDYRKPDMRKGTQIIFSVLNNREQTLKELFDKYTEEPDHYGFTKTIVPVMLLEYGDDSALFTSRSQAKRLIARFEKFEHIELDFTGIQEIGQGFADEIFRVFASMHPDITLSATNCSEYVQYMVNRASRH
jgi:anti-sigma regulatory factor (Ser/Thr protein kinase)